MNTAQKTLATLLGLSLVAMLGNSVSAHEQAASAVAGDGHHMKMDAQECHRDAFAKHMEKLHTALKLSADQEPAWKDFVGKIKPAEMNMPEHQDWHAMSTPDRMDHMLEMMKSREKSMTDNAVAVRAFYDTLSTEQKDAFDKNFQAHHHGMHEHM
ncbi:MAG: Spy/CpxP family protein refolding chaperone [Gallionella sp.]